MKTGCRRYRYHRGVSAVCRLPDRTVPCWMSGIIIVLSREAYHPAPKRVGGIISTVGAPVPRAAPRPLQSSSTIRRTCAISPGDEACQHLSMRTVSAFRVGQIEAATTKALFQMPRAIIPRTILYSRDIPLTSARQPRHIWMPPKALNGGHRRHPGSAQVTIDIRSAL
jgi:hypothetical protein